MKSIQLTIFEFKEEGHLSELATVEIDGDIWFVAADVCGLLDIKNVGDAISTLIPMKSWCRLYRGQVKCVVLI